jgi:hypothetical protein
MLLPAVDSVLQEGDFVLLLADGDLEFFIFCLLRP